MSERQAYPSDVTDEEWVILEPLVPEVKRGGRPAKYARREVINGIRYVLRTGCSWRQLPHDLPPWDTVYGYFSRWGKDGTWERLHRQLHGQLREELGRAALPAAAIMDSQSVKTTEKGASKAMTRTRRSRGANATS